MMFKYYPGLVEACLEFILISRDLIAKRNNTKVNKYKFEKFPVSS